MAFNYWDVEEDTGFCPESDPALKRILNRKAGASVVQDLLSNTYYGNIQGRPAYKSPAYQKHVDELRGNLMMMMGNRMSYRSIEDYLVTVGYTIDDIRQVFQSLTGVDPVKLEYARQADVNNTPATIPWYSLAWGWAKKKGAQAYFVNPSSLGSETGLFTVYCQVDDMTRIEVGNFILANEAIAHLAGLVKRVHRYDMPIQDEVEFALADFKDEPEKPEYRVMANYFWDLQRKGNLDIEAAEKSVKSAVYSGSLSPEEGKMMLELHVYAAPPDVKPQQMEISDTMPQVDQSSVGYQQKSTDVMDEVGQNTPQDFFREVLPERLDAVVPAHMKDVMAYISHRQKDMTEFDIGLHSLRYTKHESMHSLVETSPESGRPSGPPNATVAIVLTIKDRTLPEGDNGKFALAVFFVNPDGDIGTSDSLKGEDDVIYGFSEDGLRQYFARDRMIRGA